jgi:hypothetical protein
LFCPSVSALPFWPLCWFLSHATKQTNFITTFPDRKQIETDNHGKNSGEKILNPIHPTKTTTSEVKENGLTHESTVIYANCSDCYESFDFLNKI